MERATNILIGLAPGGAARSLVWGSWHAFCSFLRLYCVRVSLSTKGACLLRCGSRSCALVGAIYAFRKIVESQRTGKWV